MKHSVDKVNNHHDRQGHHGRHSERGSRQGVLELIHDVMHQLRARQFHSLRDGPHDITRMEARVLAFFGRHPGATLSDLAEHSGRDKAQIARLMKTLRERGLLQGTADADDRRSVHLTLTETGLALQRAMGRQSRQLAVQAVAGLSAEERTQLQQLLQRVQANLDKAG